MNDQKAGDHVYNCHSVLMLLSEQVITSFVNIDSNFLVTLISLTNHEARNSHSQRHHAHSPDQALQLGVVVGLGLDHRPLLVLLEQVLLWRHLRRLGHAGRVDGVLPLHLSKTFESQIHVMSLHACTLSIGISFLLVQ